MKRYYTINQKLIAYILLISLCLQSCGGLNNSIIPIAEEKDPQIQTDTQQQLILHTQMSIQPLVEQTVIVQGGNTVTFYEYKGELQASVEPLYEKHKVYNGIPVYIEKGIKIETLFCLDKKTQERRIHLQKEKGRPSYVAIYEPWLMGGGNILGYQTKGLAQQLQKAEQGDATAQFNLGVMYFNGEGVEKDARKAVEWFQKAANQGDATAQFNLGVMYSNGDGVEKDARKELGWYEKAANQGHAKAQFNLGVMYSNGEEVEKDARKAVKWYEKAAEQGHAKAQFNLGVRYREGLGVEKDARKAVKWYEKAANQGDASAQFNLGLMYFNGEGVEKDAKKAVEWFQKAANQGHANAQYNLGVMYGEGRGVGVLSVNPQIFR